ncbi:MAG TPA: hypothetical protein VK130_06530 [Steroidobacteraceae bacterium]|nr:hypothetical protein [Steroidobacteraceae bacterium]
MRVILGLVLLWVGALGVGAFLFGFSEYWLLGVPKWQSARWEDLLLASGMSVVGAVLTGNPAYLLKTGARGMVLILTLLVGVVFLTVSLLYFPKLVWTWRGALAIVLVGIYAGMRVSMWRRKKRAF